MRRLVLVIFLGLLSPALSAPIKDVSFVSVSNYYTRVLAKLKATNGSVAQLPSTPLTPQMVLEEGAFSYIGKVFNVQAPLHLIVDGSNADILLAWNHHLDKYIETNVVQKVPRLSVPEALARAKSYLDELEVALPERYMVKLVSFNTGYPSRWEVRWAPVCGGYAYDEFLAPYVQSVVVVFHEDYGFCGYGCNAGYPAPKSTVVKVTKEAAITQASKVAPLVMKTPFYQSARAGGFKITGVKTAELKIAAPNWLLDPARAVWIREKPPEETRLCWLVTFITADTMDRKGIKLSPVDILVYIDADTGEVVGANFS